MSAPATTTTAGKPAAGRRWQAPVPKKVRDARAPTAKKGQDTRDLFRIAAELIKARTSVLYRCAQGGDANWETAISCSKGVQLYAVVSRKWAMKEPTRAGDKATYLGVDHDTRPIEGHPGVVLIVGFYTAHEVCVLMHLGMHPSYRAFLERVLAKHRADAAPFNDEFHRLVQLVDLADLNAAPPTSSAGPSRAPRPIFLDEQSTERESARVARDAAILAEIERVMAKPNTIAAAAKPEPAPKR